MDAMATRGWGIAVSLAMLTGALVLAVTAPNVRQTPHVAERTAQARAASAPQPNVVSEDRVLLVHFRGAGPLARAERAHSARRLRSELARQRAFRGLCFVRFTHDGVALRACDGGVLTGWTARLRAMRAVARVERGE